MGIERVGGGYRVPPVEKKPKIPPTRRKRPGEPVQHDQDPPAGGDSGGGGDNGGGGRKPDPLGWIIFFIFIIAVLIYGWSRGWK